MRIQPPNEGEKLIQKVTILKVHGFQNHMQDNWKLVSDLFLC